MALPDLKPRVPVPEQPIPFQGLVNPRPGIRLLGILPGYDDDMDGIKYQTAK